jgi:hypothetical protein
MKTLLYFFTSMLLVALTFNFVPAQNIGIGTTTPAFKTDIVDSTATTLLRLRTLTDVPDSRTLLRFSTTTSNSVLNFNSSFIGNTRPTGGGSSLIFGTARENLSPGERMRLNEDGLLGIGTQNPLARLHIDLTNTTNDNAMIINDDDDPIVYFQRNNANRGFLQQLGNDFKVGTTIDNNTGNFIVRTNGADRVWFTPTGRLGIGTANPLTQLHMTGELTMQNNNPVIQMQNAAGENKSFIQTIADDMLIGTNAVNPTGNFIVRTNGANRVIVNSLGYVGLGTTPSVPLHVEGGNSPTAMAINSVGSNDLIEFRRANVSTGYIRGTLDEIEMGTYGSNNNGDLVLSTREIGRLIVHSNGRIGINTSYNGAGFQLAVDGNIICEDITTLPRVAWPDYVFSKTYRLKPLKEVENFIRENHHLPNIPSAEEIEQKGIQLGDMQKRMMEKIEELTLYIIELDKKNEVLKKEIIKLKKSKYSKNIIHY